MVHTFKALNSFFAVDTESGSVFEIDELTRLLLDKTEGIAPRFSAFEIAEAQAEIDALAERGLLFCQPPKDISVPRDDGVIKALCLNVSHACNLRCAYCFADEGTYGSKSRPLMSAETGKRAVDFLIEKSGRRKSLEIDFFGGEPLLNFDAVKEICAYARGRESECGKRFRFTITTNAVELTPDRFDFLNREFYNVVISIDGRRDVHNNARASASGADLYDRIIANARAFVEARGEGQYYIRGTFTNKNLDFSQDVCALFDAGFRHISFEPVALDGGHGLAIREEHLPRILCEYERLAELQRQRGFDFFHFRIDLHGAPCREKLLKGCGAGREYAAVSPDGRLYPCHQFDGRTEFEMGGVTDGNSIRTGLLGEGSPIERKECAACWAKYYCGGGCAANSVFIEGGIERPYRVACEMLKRRTELAIALQNVTNA